MGSETWQTKAQGRPVSDASAQITEFIEQALAAIPETNCERTKTDDGTTRFVTGSPREVAVDVTDGEVLVYLWAATWTSPYELEEDPELVGRINLETHGPSSDEKAFADALRHLVEAARTLRRMRYITCRFCEGEIPPEHQYDEQTCHGCASREYGVVY